MDADWYIHNILEERILPFVGFIGYDDFVLMHYNSRAHVAKTVTLYQHA